MHGFINIDKPFGISSAYAVDRVKKILSQQSSRKFPYKIGHAGTLDPLASGVLVLAVGEATKLVSYAMDAVKEYEFTASWGEERSTDDAEGEVTAISGKLPLLSDIEAVLEEFTGRIMQIPPAFSAIKINGRRAYELARSGQAPEMKERAVYIDSLSVIERHIDNNSEHQTEHQTEHQKEQTKTSFLVRCSKGTYIRSLARDIGRKIGVYGYVSMLRRVRVGKFTIADAILLENLEKIMHKGELGFLKPLQYALDDILALDLTADETQQIRRGQFVSNSSFIAGGVRLACMYENKLVAIACTDGAVIKPERVFNY